MSHRTVAERPLNDARSIGGHCMNTNQNRVTVEPVILGLPESNYLRTARTIQ